MSQIKKGAILSYFSIILTILIALLYTPIMIRLLGQSEYGLYALIGSVAAYFSVLDLGLGNAIIRYTSRNRAIGDKQAESNLNGMFFLLYTIIGFFTVFVGVILYNNIDNIFKSSLTTVELDKAKIMIVILTINFALSFPLSVFSSIIQSYERFVIFKLIEIVRAIAGPVIILPILLLGYGSVSMVLITTVVNILCLLYSVFYCFKYLNIKLYFSKVDFQLLKEILGYSFFIFLNVIVDQIYWKTDQVVLGIVAGTIPVAVYAIGMQFITLYKKFSTALAGLFLPRLSIMEAEKASNAEFTNIMVKFGRIQFLIMGLILSGFILYGLPFINFWAGTDYSEAYYIVLLIMVPLTIPLVQNIGISILQAKNKHAFRSIVYIIIAVLNIVITIPLATNYEGIGAALATASSLIFGHIIIMNIYYHKKIGINIIAFWKNITFMCIPIILSLSLGILINYLIPPNNILIIGEIIIYIFIYILLMWKFAMNKYEKELSLSMKRKVIEKFSLKRSK